MESRGSHRRVGVFGWGIVAPKSANIEAFATNLAVGGSWLEPFNGFGPDNFLVGRPAFDFHAYKPWIDQRFLPGRYPQLVDKMDQPTQFAIGAFIQALGQNPGLEKELHDLGTAAHIYVGTGLGAIGTSNEAALELHRAQRAWDRFWSEPEHNRTFAAWLTRPFDPPDPDVPAAPDTVEPNERERAEEAWWHFWAGRSPQLQEFLAAAREIEGLAVQGDVAAGKMSVMKEKERRRKRLQKEWGAPDPPWTRVTPNLLWNIHNTPASQISMLGKITGLAFAPVGACSTFGLTLKLAIDAIQRGEAKAVVIGAADPPPHPLTVGAFYRAKVIAADGRVSKPLTELRGTHVSGGAAIWIVGDLEYFRSRGMRPLGLEPLAVGMSSDADHIITPSREGPLTAMRSAFAASGIDPSEVTTWDLHATATPGDFQEVDNLRAIVPDAVLVTARKGTFGHGMGAAGGWELTAQYLGYERGLIFPTPLSEGELNVEIARAHSAFAFDDACPASPTGIAGKLSMGVGGINACILSRPYGD
ncbi:MAG: beta-ketoacyl synthase N-terminal-like domain-containing protein [Acidobacteriota bacterium]